LWRQLAPWVSPGRKLDTIQYVAFTELWPRKQAILDFVARVTKEGGADYVVPEQRIATFDNDGTLWSEQPMYFQLAFALDRVAALAPQHPEWKTTQPFKGLMKRMQRDGLSSI
jgi:hypothetical protein